MYSGNLDIAGARSGRTRSISTNSFALASWNSWHRHREAWSAEKQGRRVKSHSLWPPSWVAIVASNPNPSDILALYLVPVFTLNFLTPPSHSIWTEKKTRQSAMPGVKQRRLRDYLSRYYMPLTTPFFATIAIFKCDRFAWFQEIVVVSIWFFFHFPPECLQ